MRLGDFTDINFIIFFVVILVIGIVLALVTVFFVISQVQENKYKQSLDYESTTTKIYIIDAKKNRIVAFNKSDMSHKEESDLLTFYNTFHPNDVEKVKNWVFQIMVGQENKEEYLEADVIGPNKKPYFSLLHLLKYDYNIGLIHIENHILKYITPNNLPNKKNNKNVITGVVKRSQIMQIINKNKSLSGYTFGIRFFYSKQKILSNDKIERHMIMTLKNAIYPYCSNPKLPRQILDNGENELLVFDIRISNKEGAMQLANSMARSIRRQMEVNGFSGYINFCIGIVGNGQFYKDYDSIEEKVRETCISGQARGEEVVLYQRNIKAEDSLVKYNEQIEHLFQDGALRYLYRPIINVRNASITGFFEYVKAYDSPFSNFSEMSKYSARINKNIQLFATICKNVIPKFVNENQENNASLFLQISIIDINDIARTIKSVANYQKANIVLVIDEQEINENSSNLELLINSLNGLKENGFELALSLKDKNLLLNDQIYFLFHYFVVGSSMMGEVKHNNRSRLSLYNLIESLLKYERPIIATDLDGWQAVELIIKSGISYISSDAVSGSNDMLLPVEKKKMEKLVQMADKYL